MAYLTDILFKNVDIDTFIKGQVAIEKIKAVQKYIDEAMYVDNEVIFCILGIKWMEKKQEDSNELPLPL